MRDSKKSREMIWAIILHIINNTYNSTGVNTFITWFHLKSLFVTYIFQLKKQIRNSLLRHITKLEKWRIKLKAPSVAASVCLFGVIFRLVFGFFFQILLLLLDSLLAFLDAVFISFGCSKMWKTAEFQELISISRKEYYTALSISYRIISFHSLFYLQVS